MFNRESEALRMTGNKESVAHIILCIIVGFGDIRMSPLYLVLALNQVEPATERKIGIKSGRVRTHWN